ncbi:tail fiber domain-containing protein [Sorangium sp. So ce726]|uniref:tail fiber domain-containing protein n=1 Tax=Sorangium sp. So ce726 TaxID=3133319 RepID=UPI003F607D24
MTTTLPALQRTYYYDAELLQLADFVREQQYVRDLVRYQNVSIFAPGVVYGLALSAQGKVITVGAGTGFDGNGVPLFAQETTLDTTSFSLAAGTYSVQLAYGDNNVKANATTLQQTHLIVEQPVILRPTATPAPPGIVLGQITVGSDGAITGTSATGRQASAIYLQAATQPSARSAAAPAAAAATSGPQSFAGPLSVGAGAARGSAMLSVSQDLDAQPEGASVARFDFADRATGDAGVSIGVKKAGGRALISARHGGNEVWELGQDGTARTLSDASLKVDVLPIAGALDRTRALRPVSFAWSSDPERRRRLGLLAQEVAPVVPEVVGASSEGRPTLAYQELVPLLVQAIHELADRVVELERERDGGRGRA